MSERKSIEVNCKIAKVDNDRRLATVIVSEVTKADGTPVVDHQGDVIKIEDAEDADIEAFADGGIRMGGEMHAKIGGADVVQHFTLSSKEREALGFGKGPELWIAKLRVTDNELWKKVKDGKLPDISISGTGERELIEDAV